MSTACLTRSLVSNEPLDTVSSRVAIAANSISRPSATSDKSICRLPPGLIRRSQAAEQIISRLPKRVKHAKKCGNDRQECCHCDILLLN